MFTDDEKKLLLGFVKRELQEVKECEKIPNTSLKMFSSEVEYQHFLEALSKKLEG